MSRTTTPPEAPSAAPAVPAPAGPGIGITNSVGSCTRPASCADCFFWDQPSGGAIPPTRSGDATATAWWRDAGYCRQSGPGPGPAITSQQRTGWPVTHKNDWCAVGEVR